MIHELKLFFHSIALWIFALFGLTAVFMTPLYQGESLSARVFAYLVREIVPSSVQIIVSNPLDAFLTLVGLSLALSFIIVSPVLIYGVMEYFAPALKPRERAYTIYIVIPSALLFLAGCVFAYKLIIPTTFELLYGFADTLNAEQLFLAPQFIQLTFSIIVTTGFAFLLPIGMMLVSATKIISRIFWTQQWRYALAFFLIFSAIITPDGTGITMLMLCLPFTGLYVLGCILSGVVGRKN